MSFLVLIYTHDSCCHGRQEDGQEEWWPKWPTERLSPRWQRWKHGQEDNNWQFKWYWYGNTKWSLLSASHKKAYWTVWRVHEVWMCKLYAAALSRQLCRHWLYRGKSSVLLPCVAWYDPYYGRCIVWWTGPWVFCRIWHSPRPNT